MLYNDAYRPILGATKHPKALGQPGRECWPEIWHIIGPMLEGVITRGEATWSEDQLLLLDRNGFLEECYFTFSYSPIHDETGTGGVFTAVTETTGRLVSQRRMRTLAELSTLLTGANAEEQICRLALEILARNHQDLPFSALYLFSNDCKSARLAGQTGLAVQAPNNLAWLEMTGHRPAEALWQGLQVHPTGLFFPDDSLYKALDLRPDTPGIQPVTRLVSLPVGGLDSPLGVLVVGISPYRVLDEDYRDFLSLVSGQIASALATERAFETERKRAEALAELDRAKTEFFSNVSHEFRTPITLILAPIQDALQSSEDGLSEVNRERFLMVYRNGLRLLKLVNTLLDFSRIEAGRIRATYRPVDLATLTADLAGVFRSTIEHAGLRLNVDCPPLPELVYVDSEMWEKIVLNLLSNAFKFTFEGQIHLSLAWQEGQAVLCVADTGMGIAPEEIPHIFERFHQATGTRSRSVEGSGIGLALVQELVRLHGGEVTVSSAVGQGSVFCVTVPGGYAHLPANRVRMEPIEQPHQTIAQYYVEEAQRWQPAAESLPNLKPSDILGDDQDRPTRPSQRGVARILLVDDNADMRAYLVRLLASRWTVEAVADGLAALQAIQASPPDLVLADVMMPGMDGFELLRQVRQDPQTRDLPMILVSARAGEEAQVEGLERGADDYLVKPFTARELLARVESRLELAHMRSETQRKITGILESVTDAFWAIDHHWCITYANLPAASLIGQPPEHLTGQDIRPYLQSFLEEDNWRALELAMQQSQTTAFEQHRPDSRAWYAFRAYPNDGGLSVFAADITIEKNTAEMQQRIEMQRHLLENREKERQEIARDIHDGPIQTLVSTIFNAQFAKEALQEPVAVLELEQIGLSLKGAVRELREVVNELRPPALIRFGLAKAIRINMVDFEEKHPQIEVHLELQEDETLLAELVSLTLYRVFQEGLNNIARHAHASQVWVRLQLSDQWVIFEMQDNGRGFVSSQASELTQAGHYGLAGMRERVDAIHGEMKIISAPNRGTTVRVRVPWASAAREKPPVVP